MRDVKRITALIPIDIGGLNSELLFIKISSQPVRRSDGKTAVIRTGRPELFASATYPPGEIKNPLGEEKKESSPYTSCMEIVKCPRVIIERERLRLSRRQNDTGSPPTCLKAYSHVATVDGKLKISQDYSTRTTRQIIRTVEFRERELFAQIDVVSFLRRIY